MEAECSRKNRLAREKSPYLRLHACNPVDWYPWGREAFEAAKRLDKPLFISIGYSTCHWCHVMARESFEDPGVASILNRVFVNVKVDREELPDVDRYYMAYCQVAGEGCGWPLTIVALPDGRPFFVATYLTRDQLIDLALNVERVWRERRHDLEYVAGRASGYIEELLTSRAEAPVSEDALHTGYTSLKGIYDPDYGGFGRAPKFPSPHYYLFLLRYWLRYRVSNALEMCVKSIDAMIYGGIRDHIGGGFHRYSTDRYWILPHFEKMLYDQATMIMALTELYQATGSKKYMEVAVETFDFLSREMESREGGFYSAIDAESGGIEGGFYTYTASELREVLGDDYSIASKVFNVIEDGNYRDEATRVKTGRNILYTGRPPEEIARSLGISPEELESLMARIKGRLLEYREATKPKPLVDTKILADWNGLAIAALSQLYMASLDERILNSARRAALFIEDKMMDGDLIYHVYKDGEARVEGFLDDYAYVLWGLIDLYQATGEPRFMELSLDVANAITKNLWRDDKGLLQAREGSGSIMAGKPAETYDSSYPSGYSAATYNLLRLSRLTGEVEFEEKAKRLLRIAGGLILNAPLAHISLLLTLDYILGPSYEVVVVEGSNSSLVSEFRSRLAGVYMPRKVIVFKGREGDGVDRLASYTRSMIPLNGLTSFYVCRNHVCNLPVVDAVEAIRMIKP